MDSLAIKPNYVCSNRHRGLSGLSQGSLTNPLTHQQYWWAGTCFLASGPRGHLHAHKQPVLDSGDTACSQQHLETLETRPAQSPEKWEALNH